MTRTQPEPEDGALGRRARKALATRHAMFSAGLAAFEHRPIGMVSVLDVTEGADVAKGVFYLHFPGKDEYLIALWQHVQRIMLDSIRARLETCRSRRARFEAAAAYYHAMAVDGVRECRFWLRMSSYFGEEIGQPGQLARQRQEYLQQLAALINGMTLEQVDAASLRRATILDGAAWGLISQSLQQGEELLDREAFVRVVLAAIRAVE